MSEKIPLGALARTPGLLIRLGFSVLKFKRRVRVSARKLKRGLVKNGMNRKRANELVCEYEEGLSFKRLIKMAMGHSDSSSIPFIFSR